MKATLVFAMMVGTLFADQVVLKNGDRVTGSIVRKDAKVVTIQTDKIGLVSAP